MRKVKIVVDTREQRPWKFPGLAVVRRKLNYGDYALAGRNGWRKAVERKSPEDLAHCATSDLDRFSRSLSGASIAGVAILVIVDGSFSQFRAVLRRWSQSRDPYATLAKLCDQTGQVPLFAGTRSHAAKVALRWLSQ